jgi:hypothetical protein
VLRATKIAKSLMKGNHDGDMVLKLEDKKSRADTCARLAERCGKRGSAKGYQSMSEDLDDLSAKRMRPTLNIIRQWVVECCQQALSSRNKELFIACLRLATTSEEADAEKDDFPFDKDTPCFAHVVPTTEDEDAANAPAPPKPELAAELLTWEKDCVRRVCDSFQ